MFCSILKLWKGFKNQTFKSTDQFNSRLAMSENRFLLFLETFNEIPTNTEDEIKEEELE